MKQREPVGYVILDLRAAVGGVPPYPEKWYPLINAKNSSPFRPEIKISFVVSMGKTTLNLQQELPSKQPKQVEMKQPSMAEHTTTPAAPLAAVLTQDGYYQVGNADTGQSMFTLWITISFAENLDRLFASDPNATVSFYFYYSFLGNDILTQRFQDLLQPNFPAERVSIKFRAHLNDLMLFLDQLSKIVVYFCQDEQVIGFTDISLTPLSKKTLGKDVANVENVYQLFHPKGEHIDGENLPRIGMSMALSLDAAVVHAQTSLNVPISTSAATEGFIKGKDENRQSVNVQELGNSLEHKATQPITQEHPIQTTPQYSLHLQSDHDPAHGPFSTGNIKLSRAMHSSVQWEDHAPEIPTRDEPLPPDPCLQDVSWNQFRFSIELRSVSHMKLYPSAIFFKYVYTPFGTTSPIITHPPLQLHNLDSEQLLPHSFCAFEFVMGNRRLETYLDAVPLVIELWIKDPMKKNIMAGSASVDLSAVLGQKRSLVDGVKIASLDCSTVIMSPEQKKVGELRTLIALEDFGKVMEDDRPADAFPESMAAKRLHFAPSPSRQPPRSDIHGSLEYETAIELELWRQKQQEIFEEQWKSRQALLEEHYSAEWQHREQERRKLMEDKLEEYRKMTLSVEELAFKLRKREQELEIAERSLKLEREDLERQVSQHIEQTRQDSKHLSESLQHSKTLLQSRLDDALSTLARVEHERDTFRTKVFEMDSKQSDVQQENIRTVEKYRSEASTLQKRCDTLVRSRHDMKKKYKVLFACYTQIKTQLEEVSTISTHMPVRSRAPDGPKVIAPERSESTPEPPAALSSQSSPKRPPPSHKHRADIERLTKEKNELLDTGVYLPTDALIRDLSDRIGELLSA